MQNASRGLLSLSAAYFTLGTGSLAVIGLLDPMARHFHVGNAAIAQLVTVFALTFALAAPLLQAVFGRLPRRTVIIAGLLVLAAGSLASALAPSFAFALAARVVMALGAAAIGPLASALGASLVPQERQAKALATVFGGMTIATVLGVPLSAWLGAAVSWQAVFVLLAAVALACAAAVARLVDDRGGAQPVALADFVQVFAQAATGWGIAATFFQMAAQLASYTLIAVLLQERFGAPASWLSPALLLFGMGGVAGNALAGRIGDRIGVDRLLSASIAGLALVFVALSASPARPSVALGLLIGWAVIAMLFQAPQQKRLIGLAPQLRGLLLAMNASAIYLGMSGGAYVGSLAYRLSGAGALPVVSAALAIATGCAFVLSRRAATRDARAARSGAVNA